MIRRHRRSAVSMSISAATMAATISPLARADTTASWDGTTNNWSSAADWSTNPNYPNNGTPAGSLYDVIVSAGTITLNVNPTIQLMNMSGGTISGSDSLTILGLLTWSGGTLDAAAETADGGIDFHGNGNATLYNGILTNPAGQSATIGATGNFSLGLAEGATFNNAGTLTATKGQIDDGGGVFSTLNNSGTMNVDEPSGTFSIASGLQFNNTAALMIQGGTLSIASPYNGSPDGTVSVSSSGALTSSAKFTQPAGITNNGALVFDATGDTSGAITGAGSLTIGGGTFQLDTGSGASSLDKLTVSAGSLDITNNHIFINYAGGADPISSIAAWIKSGYAGGAWNGPGIISSAAATNSNYGIGYADSADPGNPANLSSSQIEIKYTLLGDATLAGTVDVADFGILAANFNKGVTGWDKGDFFYQNTVDVADFQALASNFNKGASGADLGAPAIDYPSIVAFAQANGLMADLTSVPEPTSIGLVAFGTIATLARRRRQRTLNIGRSRELSL